MSERIFSGITSEPFWVAVHQSKDKDILYDYGCKAQDLEALNKQLLVACKAWGKFINKLPKDFELQVFLYHLFNEAKELTEQAIEAAEKILGGK